MKIRKKIVLATLAVVFLFLVGATFFKITRLPAPIALDTRGNPTIGTGSIEIVLFEDLCCTNCRIFTEEILPKIASQYVETRKARFTLVPVSFGDHSKPLANAAFAVYVIAPNRFMVFLLSLLHSKASGLAGILDVAKTVGGIDLVALKESMDKELYYGVIDQNLVWAKKLMGPEFGTPTLFVGGIETSTASFTEVEKRMRQIAKAEKK